jgi:hypothetical protein
VGRLVSALPRYIKRAETHLGPIIKHRLLMEAAYGADWPGKPVSVSSVMAAPHIQTITTARTTLSVGFWTTAKATNEISVELFFASL